MTSRYQKRKHSQLENDKGREEEEEVNRCRLSHRRLAKIGSHAFSQRAFKNKKQTGDNIRTQDLFPRDFSYTTVNEAGIPEIKSVSTHAAEQISLRYIEAFLMKQYEDLAIYGKAPAMEHSDFSVEYTDDEGVMPMQAPMARHKMDYPEEIQFCVAAVLYDWLINGIQEDQVNAQLITSLVKTMIVIHGHGNILLSQFNGSGDEYVDKANRFESSHTIRYRVRYSWIPKAWTTSKERATHGCIPFNCAVLNQIYPVFSGVNYVRDQGVTLTDAVKYLSEHAFDVSETIKCPAHLSCECCSSANVHFICIFYSLCPLFF